MPAMKDAAPQIIYLADYTPPAFLVDEVHLTFRLAPGATRVISRIAFRPNPDATSRAFFLHGEAGRLRDDAAGDDARPSCRDGPRSGDGSA